MMIKKLLERLDRRFWVSITLTVTLLAALILSSGLSQLTLERGDFLVPAKTTSEQAAPNLQEEVPFRLHLPRFEYIAQIAQIAFWILIPMAVFVVLFDQDSRWRRYLGTMLSITGFIMAIRFLQKRGIRLNLGLSENRFDGQATQIPMPAFSQPPTWLAFLVGFILMLLILGMGWYLQRLRRKPATSLEELAQHAQNALDDLEAGLQIEDTVLRCYYQMVRALNKHRGIRRHQSMTVREFEKHLQELGVHGEHVHQLTLLFEKIRYGGERTNDIDKQAAIHCLSAILSTLGAEP